MIGFRKGWKLSPRCRVGLLKSTRNMMLCHRNKENFIVVPLSIVSSNFMAVHSDFIQRSYVGRWILISVGVRDALFVHRSPG